MRGAIAVMRKAERCTHIGFASPAIQVVCTSSVVLKLSMNGHLTTCRLISKVGAGELINGAAVTAEVETRLSSTVSASSQPVFQSIS